MSKSIKNTQVILNQAEIGYLWTTGEVSLNKTEDQIRNIIFSCHHVPDTVWDIWEYSPAGALAYALDINNCRKYAPKILNILTKYRQHVDKLATFKNICDVVWSMFQYDPGNACRYIATVDQRQGFIPSEYDELVHQYRKFKETTKTCSLFAYNPDLEEVGLDDKALLLTFSAKNTLNILSGKKTLELRKSKPRFFDFVLICERESKTIVGSFNGSLVGKKTSQLWKTSYISELQMSVTEVNTYLGNNMGYGIAISNVKKFSKPISQNCLKMSHNSPANKEFRYLSSSQIKEIGGLNG